ncbi:MAG: AI-2E family transporter [Alphaproteobacteria bacterium]|nr:AI-2E family transporter [Alphaproteobacteria bacterium]
MSIEKQSIFWVTVLALIILSLWLLQAVLLPFVLGATIAYLLDPLVERLDKWGINRALSTILILTVSFAVFVLIVALIVPALYNELRALIEALPEYIEKAKAFILPYIDIIKEKTGLESQRDIIAILYEQKATAFKASNTVLNGLAAGGSSLVTLLSIIALTPLSAYFFIKEWPRIMAYLEQLLPRAHEKTLKMLLNKMHNIVSGFIRGQLMVAFFLAIFYAIALKLAGLQYGVIIGLSAGFLSIIPMLGAIGGLIAATATAWLTTFEFGYTGLIAGIFIFGQILEGNFLTPKLVGDQVGLHPLWVIFAVMAGGALMGLAGMFLAVPIAAIIGVLIGFAISQYKATPLYTGKTKAVKKAPTKAAKKKTPQKSA